MCEFVEFPEVKFSSTSDQTGAIPGLVCSKLEEPLPGGSINDYLKWNKLAQLIEELP